MIINMHDLWDDAAERQKKYIAKRIRDVLERELSRGPMTKALFDVLSFIYSNLNDIVDSKNTDFTNVIASYDALFPAGGATTTDAEKWFAKIFDYEGFRDGKYEQGWNAYELCNLARYKVCPYCHINTTETELKGGPLKGYRGDLDHYLPQSEFPYLALSLGNLVLSCKLCNGSSMKHTKNFHVIPHLNPLKDNIEFEFRLCPANNGDWTPTLSTFKERPSKYEIQIIALRGGIKAQNSLETFQLHPRYQPFLYEAHRVARVGRNSGWFKSVLRKTFLQMTIEDELGFDSVGDGYKHVSTGKMRKDVFDATRG
ncbi:hypothetical protein PTKU46_58700 [Paraburkholderia terrae]|uniref:HNH endonuclease n=1 Tax=Paraburkholderia terrae TaxID=311230 RepID=UPI0030E5ACBB